MGATWGTKTVEPGTVTGGGARDKRVDVPGDFSSAVTLVVTLSAERFTPDAGVALHWWLFDSVDGERMQVVEDTAGAYRGEIGHLRTGPGKAIRSNFQTRRFVVPFGPRLYFGVGVYDQQTGTKATVDASFENVIATVFWRGLG